MKNILFVVAECQGFIATGGLAEVAGSLPKAIMSSSENYKVSVVMPLYKKIIEKYADVLEDLGKTKVKLAWRNCYCGVFKLNKNGIDYYFIDNKYYFNRDGIYGHFDDGERFAFFSKSIFSIFKMIGFTPDIIHAHDWHTALTCVYLDMFKKKRKFIKMKSVFTIHNIEYQGIYDFAILGDVFDLGNEEEQIVNYNGKINLVKGAIATANKVTTVSPTYAKEILLPEYSCGLSSIINETKDKISGVINGIDTALYNPACDDSLKATYDAETFKNKAINKEALQTALGLNVLPNTCIISVISRLASHKGIELILGCMDDIMRLGIQFVVIGTGDANYENAFKSFERKYPKKMKVLLEFNFELAKQIYGSSDLFLMPSKMEPCGLSQMIASRYGTVPIVRGTGGLYDTIKDYSDSGNGFVFFDYNSSAMLEKIKEAVKLYSNTDKYIELAQKIMKIDFSWKVSAQAYLGVYKELSK